MEKVIFIISLFFINNIYAGGISSGGGDTLPKEPVTIYEIEDIIEDSKLELRLLLKEKLLTHQTFSSPLSDKIYKKNNNIFDVLEKTKIKILMNQPCLDFDGNEVDGSVSKDEENTICISAFLTAPKLSKERARNEILALIVHELSHMLGTTEDEADKLQIDMRRSLREFTSFAAKNYIQLLFDDMRHIRGLLSLDKRIKNKNYNKMQEALSLALTDLSNYWDHLYSNYSLSIFDKYQADFDEIMMDRFRLLNWYVRGMSDVRDSDYAKREYNNFFGNDNKLSVAEKYKRIYKREYSGHYGNYMFNKINSIDELKKEIDEIYEYYSAVYNYIFVLRYHEIGSLPEIPSPK